MAATDRSRSEAAKQRRQDQLQRWLGSETDTGGGPRDSEDCSGGPGGPGGPPGPGPPPGPGGGGGGGQKNQSAAGAGRVARVRFAQGAVFMAACSAGDREEVAALLRQGADINHANVDGLTALHQACIDDNIEMVQFLLESGSNVNHGDNEGWTPLHAAASCAFIQIAKYLIEHGAHVGAVNSEGELPLDVATDDAMSRALKAEIKKQGIDVDKARKEEERVMLEDAKAVLAGSGTLRPHPNTKATAMHVAAAKGYIEVMKVLLQCGMDVDSRDSDSWTPLHAAAHWGQEEVCTLLTEHMCDMTAVNTVGQTPLDVADENLVDTLEELQKKQNALRSEREKLAPVIDTSPPISMAPVRTRRTSISRMSSREKICLHERDKHPPPPALQSPPAEEDEEEAGQQHAQSQAPPTQAKASSSSSSEEESESESDAESEKAKNREIINNLNNKRNNTTTSLLSTSMATSATGNTLKKEPAKPSAPEAPGSWRTSLRKAGSSVTLGSAGGSDPSPDPPGGLGMTRSASSPRLSSEAADTKEPRLARVPPTPTRRLFSIPDSSTSADSASNSWLSRSSSYTRRLHSSQSGSDLSGSSASSNAFLPRSSSYGRRLDDPAISSAPSGLNRLNNLVSQRLTQEATEKKEQPSVTTTSGSTTFSGTVTSSTTSGSTTSTTTTSTTTSGSLSSSTAVDTEAKQRRKSYLTPVRDEEAEAQRKARSRHARQSRRSTQGVTLTDLQEAEKSMKTTENNKDLKTAENKDNKDLKTSENKENKGKEEDREQDKDKDNKKKAEEGEVSWRSRIASLQKSDLLGLTQPAGTPRPQTSDTTRPQSSDKKDGVVVGTGESETERWARESRERRRARAKRRGQRTGESDDNEPSGEDEVSASTADTQSERQLTSRSDPAGGSASKDYKKLFEEVSRENNHLHSQLQDTQRIISQTRVELEKAAQRQERFSDCSALLELEKKERRMLERRVAELEEELKVLGDLRADNQRLKDENGALIRVISKLSK